MMTEPVTLLNLAKMIDHSLLHPTLTDQALAEGCAVAGRYNVATACVKPYAVAQAHGLLAGSDVAVYAVVGFPHGNSATAIKIAETAQVLRAGAAKVDMVIHISKVGS